LPITTFLAMLAACIALLGVLFSG